MFLTVPLIDTMLTFYKSTTPSNFAHMNLKLLPASLLLMTLVVGCSRSGIDKMPDFRSIPEGTPRKEAFIEHLSPLVERVNREISKERQRAQELERSEQLTLGQRAWLRRLAKKYRVKVFNPAKPDWRSLLKRVDTIPPSLVLAQSANESAWGTSRFARKGNNYFGQWCFKAGCGIVPEERSHGMKHEVAVFESPRDSIRSYIMNLNTHRAYEEVRTIRESLRINGQDVSGIPLANGLSRYSERGLEYIDELKKIIHINGLEKLDRP